MKNMKKWLILGIYLFVTTFVFGQQTVDWANFERYAEQNKAVKTPPKVVFIGNSITEGWWYADSLYFKNNGYQARGISGQVTSQMLVRFRKDVIDLKPQAVVILAGANDIAENNGYISLDNIKGNIVSMIELARLHKIDVVLCSVLPAYDFSWHKGLEPAPKILELNRMLKAYADRNKVIYVDYHSRMADERNGLPEKYSGDGVHPNPEGYKVMESILQPVLKRYK